MKRLREMVEGDQERVLEIAMKLFEIRYAESDVVVEHGVNPGDVVESWEDCLVIGEHLLEMWRERCR